MCDWITKNQVENSDSFLAKKRDVKQENLGVMRSTNGGCGLERERDCVCVRRREVDG